MPFAHWLMRVAKPAALVELGTHTGVSYTAFCESVRRLRLTTRTNAVDTWKGDRHSLRYGEEVYEEFRNFHDRRYGAFSHLLRCTFDEARTQFSDRSIDLLHIDGLHTHEAVTHDFENWAPKLSPRAIVLFHDICEHRDDFGVWKLWEGLCQRYPNFEFLHGHGLGMLLVGEQPPPAAAALSRLKDETQISVIRERFRHLGEQIEHSSQQLILERELRQLLVGAEGNAIAAHERAEQAEARTAERMREVASALTRAEKAEKECADQAREAALARAQAEAAENEAAEQARKAMLTQAQHYKTADALAQALRERDALHCSTLWRITQRLQILADKMPPWMRRAARDAVQFAWRSVALWLPRGPREQRTLAMIYDPEWYRKTYPDVAAAGADPLSHYLSFGAAEGRDPGPEFSTRVYLANNPDVAARGINPLLHFLFGRGEGRDTSPVQSPERSYENWIYRNERLGKADLADLRRRGADLAHRPKISILMPTYNTPEQILAQTINSVLAQTYENWELCIADDASTSTHVGETLRRFQRSDPRIKIMFRQVNGGISLATNSALELASGEWVAMLDHDDLLAPHALFHVVAAISARPDIQMIYSDEDKVNEMGQRYDPYFKPDFSLELFRSQNYLNHFAVYRKKAIEAVGGWRPGFEGSQDYDLNLRIIERIKPSAICHIPAVLYHWRAIRGSTAFAAREKTYAYAAGLRALREHAERLGLPARVEEAPGVPYYRMRFKTPNPAPLVSIIVPTRDRAEVLRTCGRSILDQTTYEPFELLIVDNGSVKEETAAVLAEMAGDARVRVLTYPHAFNYSAINNFAARAARGEILALLNNDVEVISPDWLTEMVAWAAQPKIGCVGAKLYYPNDWVQHAGVILGIGGVAGHSHKHYSRDHPGYFGRLKLVQNISAVTGACLVVRKEVYERAGGLDEENLAVAFNDVDFCLKIREAGYRNVWTPFAELYHHESVSRGYENTQHKRKRFAKEVRFMLQKWGDLLVNDPFYSPHLTKKREDFSVHIG